MKNLFAFLLGIWEFRSDCTTHQDEKTENFYDWGREIAHRITFRKFDY